MIVNKFGGASVKDAVSVERMANICKSIICNGVLVVSAMGKTTNLLEKTSKLYFDNKSTEDVFSELESYHRGISNNLNLGKNNKRIDAIFKQLQYKLKSEPSKNFDFEYDQIVSFGELLSTTIIAEFLNKTGLPVKWIDVRTVVFTDNVFRNAKVNWELSAQAITETFKNTDSQLYITQGFLGSTEDGHSTTLGREGSDYTAAIIANALNAQKVTVWKDVPGIMSADPKWIKNTKKIDELSYLEAIELAFFGAKVIHPKTIKPLRNKNIPLQVRSFIDTDNPGTIISTNGTGFIPPVYIKMDKQVLISIKPFDFSFIVEENISHIFSILAKNQIKVNLMQNSAISFSVVVDNDLGRVANTITELKKYYDVKYNEPLELITIRHTQPNSEHEVLKDKKILVEQKSRIVARYVVR